MTIQRRIYYVSLFIKRALAATCCAGVVIGAMNGNLRYAAAMAAGALFVALCAIGAAADGPPEDNSQGGDAVRR